MQNQCKLNGEYECANQLAKRCKESGSRFHVQSKVRGDLQCVIGGLKGWFQSLQLHRISGKGLVLIFWSGNASKPKFDLHFFKVFYQLVLAVSIEFCASFRSVWLACI